MNNPKRPNHKLINANKLKAIIFILINAAIFTGIYLWAEQNLALEKILSATQNLSLPSFIISFIIGLTSLIIYAHRLRLIIKLPFKQSLSIVSIGHAFNNLLPFRLGEPIKLIAAKKLYKVPIPSLLLGTIIEKALDLTAVCLIGGIVITFSVMTITTKIFLIPATIIITILIALITTYCLPNQTHKIISWIKSQKHYQILQNAINDLHLWSYKTKLVLFSVLLWTIVAILFYSFFKMNLPNHSLNIIDALALVFITATALTLPATPANIGIFEAGLVYYLVEIISVELNLAVALSLAFHIVMVLPILCITTITFGSRLHYFRKN